MTNNKRRKKRQTLARSTTGATQRSQTPGTELPKKVEAFLSLPAWSGISAFIALFAFIGVIFNGISDSRDSVAHVEVTHTFRSDEPGTWSVISSARNHGPAVADSLRMIYTAKNSLCFSGTLLPENDGSARFDLDPETQKGAACGGVELIGVEPATQDELAGLFIRDFSSVADLKGVGLASGSIDSFKVGDVGWIEFTFRVAPELDSELQQLIPESAERLNEEARSTFLDVFSVPEFQGHKVDIRSVELDATRRWAPLDQDPPADQVPPSPVP